MTKNEQTIANLKKLKSFHNGSYGADIDRAIEVLEQEPCEDAISRKWVLDVVKNFVFDTETDRNRIIHIVRDTAPSVTPKEKQDPILDKIRAEIRHFMYDVNPSSSESDYACDYILDVIDKYRAESEEKTNG